MIFMNTKMEDRKSRMKNYADTLVSPFTIFHLQFAL